MEERVILDEEGKGHYRIYDSGDFEYQNPVDFYRKTHIQSTLGILTDLLGMSRIPINNYRVRKMILLEAIQLSS